MLLLAIFPFVGLSPLDTVSFLAPSFLVLDPYFLTPPPLEEDKGMEVAEDDESFRDGAVALEDSCIVCSCDVLLSSTEDIFSVPIATTGLLVLVLMLDCGVGALTPVTPGAELNDKACESVLAGEIEAGESENWKTDLGTGAD